MHRLKIQFPGGRGVAMVLVLFALAVVFILSFAFASAQSVSVQISRNITARAQARMIAESGLGMAVEYVTNADNWRAEQFEGVWAEGVSLAGGSFTIHGNDGEDTNGDGVIEGDGDLSNYSLDLLTVTVVGEYRGAKFTARALIFPRKRVLMVVEDPNLLVAEDTARIDLLHSWGWTVCLIGERAKKDEFDAAAADNIHVVYFPAHVELEKDVKDRLKKLQLPIVTGHGKLVKELKIADGESKDYAGSAIDILQLSRVLTDDLDNEYTEIYTHYITEPFPIGSLSVCAADDELLRLDGKMVGTEALAAKADESNRITLAILESGALKSDKKPAPARRVALPWGSDRFSIASLDADGQKILRRSLDWAGSSWKGMLPGLSAWDKVEIKGGGKVDGFNSALGPYGGANVNADATISTNSIKKDKVKIEGGTLLGDIFIGPTADASKVVEISGGGSVSGKIKRLDLSVPVGNLMEPTGLPGEIGDVVYSTGTVNLSQDLHVKHLTIKGDAKVRVMNDIVIYCKEEFKIQDDAQIVLEQNGKLTIYTKKEVKVEHNAQVNLNTADPTRLNILVLKKKVQVKDSAQIYACVQGYDAHLELKDNAQFYGAFVGKKVKVDNNAAAHVDTSITGTEVTMGSGTDLRRLTQVRVQWLGQP